MPLRILIALALSAPAAFAQCETPQGEIVAPAQRDLTRIFGRFEQQLATLAAFQNAEKLIVPNERVGNFVLGVGKTEIEATAPLKSQGIATDAAYEDILPLGYVPERSFARHPSEKLRFAFSSTDLTLKEVFVTGAEYKTAAGLGIGSTLDTVKRSFPAGAEKLRGAKIYWVAEGITFVFEKGAATTVVVFGKKKGS